MEPHDRPEADPQGHTPAPASAHAQLVQALELALGGFRLLDQGLELTGGGFVHLLGVDGVGSLVLVLLVSESDEETVARGLEGLELATDHGPVLHHHLTRGRGGATGLDGARAPRLLLVGEAFDLARVRRLSTFCGRQTEAELFELRILRSGSGESLYLHRLAGNKERAKSRPSHEIADERVMGLAQAAATAPAAPVLRPPEPPTRAQRGDLLELFTQRLRGLDATLGVRNSSAGRAWSHQDNLLVEARLEMDASLTVRLADTEPVRVYTVRELDSFVERVVTVYLRRLGGN